MWGVDTSEREKGNRKRNLLSGAHVLGPLHLAHAGKLQEAPVVKVVLDTEVVAISARTDPRLFD